MHARTHTRMHARTHTHAHTNTLRKETVINRLKDKRLMERQRDRQDTDGKTERDRQKVKRLMERQRGTRDRLRQRYSRTDRDTERKSIER